MKLSSFCCARDFVLIKWLRLAELYTKVSILQDFAIHSHSHSTFSWITLSKGERCNEVNLM